MKYKNNGFTLIEVSLVLLIIGLLLGGLLKGQELVKAARVRNIATLNSGVQAAYFGFLDRYRRLPGDWNDRAAATIGVAALQNTGNDNGRIESITEAAGVWEQLSRAGFISGNYSDAGAVTDANGYRRPTAAPQNPYQGFLALSHNRNYAGANQERLTIHLGDMPAEIAAELDRKIDDGRPVNGSLRIAQQTGGAVTGITAPTSTDCLAGDDYNIQANPPGCNIAYLIE